jgi:uncharacterized SAM-binding protein YcdF (DUF218 family)
MTLAPDVMAARSLVEMIWAYNQLQQQPRAADLLLVMGTNDLRVADHAAFLAKKFAYRYIVCSGGKTHRQSFMNETFGGVEANVLAARLIERGIDPQLILHEDQATNTGENVIYTRDLLIQRGTIIKTGQLVHVPSMERRALATAQRQWPEVEWSVSSWGGSYEDYVAGADEQRFINIMVGDTCRILTYVDQGFQTEQPMPDDVRQALGKLIESGFNRHLPEGWSGVT